jgi:hypothetical protein
MDTAAKMHRSAGDFNNDGFCDLYVANIGVNRLYVNQGDGSFRDATAAAGLDRKAWTTSSLLADLSGDGLPDIYDVNYVDGADVFDRICPQQEKPRICSPTFFQPQPDCFYLNLGDGRFAEGTEAAGLNAAGGNGLGVVAGDLDGSGRLSLFVDIFAGWGAASSGNFRRPNWANSSEGSI